MSTADATSAADGPTAPRRPRQRYGRIIVVGGGCYGSYYVRQLGRAERAGAVEWAELLVVDHDAACSVARVPVDAQPPRTRLVVSDWNEFFASYFAEAVGTASGDDAVVPSPLMPHLMADWLVDRARARWPSRAVRVARLDGAFPVPWQRTGEDGTHYVSFAEWMCPINCIEPARCPETRGARSWSLPTALHGHADEAQARGEGIGIPLLLHCTHRTFGVGMIDVRDVLAADAAIARHGESEEASFLIGTVSHCHGALRRVTVGAP